MSKSTTISFAEIAPVKQGVAILLSEEGALLSPAGKTLDKASGGVITQAAKERKFKGKKRSSLDILVPAKLGLSRLLLVGAGSLKDYSGNDWVELGGQIRAMLSSKDNPKVTLVLEAAKKPGISGEQSAQVALGAMLRGYKFDKYKTKAGKKDQDSGNNDTDLARLTVQCTELSAARRAFSACKA